MVTTVPCAQTYSFESVILGLYVFKSIWSPFVDETLALKQEMGNREVRFAVAVIQRQSWPAAVTTIVSHKMAIEAISVNFKMSTMSLMICTVLFRFFAIAAAMNDLRHGMKLPSKRICIKCAELQMFINYEYNYCT